MTFHNKSCQRSFENLQKSVTEEYPDLNLDYPYIDHLCHQTQSPRIMSLIKQAYYLGMARGIKRVDEGMRPVRLDPVEIPIED